MYIASPGSLHGTKIHRHKTAPPNIRVQWSAASEFLIFPRVPRAAPTDASRSAAGTLSDEKAKVLASRRKGYQE